MLTKVTDRMRSGASVNIFDYIPKAEHAAIQAGTSTYDCTSDIAAAIADASAVTGAAYGYEKVIIFPQGWYSVQHIDVTARRNVWFYTDDYVIIRGTDSTAKNFILGSTNFNAGAPESSTQTPNFFMGGNGQWELSAVSGTSYEYGLRLEHFTSSHFENVSAGSGYVAEAVSGDVIAAYLQYSYSNLFVNCDFSCPAAPPAGKLSIGLSIGNNNNNSNTFIRCNWQGASATSAPYTGTVGVKMSGSNNVWDNCDLSALEIAFFGNGRGIQLRNIYSEYVTNFYKGAAAGQNEGMVVQGGIIEIVGSGSAFVPQNTESLTIIGGYYKGALAGTKTFIDQTGGTSPGTLYGLNVIGPRLATGDFANMISGTYRNPDTLAEASVLQTKWLTFPSTQIVSTEPNTLDDYEEGTWTPAKGAGAVFTSASGRYTKIGNTVVATFLVEFPTETLASAATITGLPFSAIGVASERNGLGVGYNTASVNVGGSLSTTTISLRLVGAGGGDPTYTQMSGATFSGVMTYTI